MDQIKKIILVGIPMSICNLRCSYCYLAQRDECYQGIQPTMRYSPEHIARAFSRERIGGSAFFNICADGETLLTKNIDQYVKAILEQGHYVELVSNMTVTPMIEKILRFDRELLQRLEFKSSFHYLELKKRGLLHTFAENVNKAWEAGASATVETTPPDELIPYIDEMKAFSMKHFGALPHLSIARNDRTEGIEYLTELPLEEYDATWRQFDSGFWAYKRSVFGVRQKEFCYAGAWSINVDLSTGKAYQCYGGRSLGNILEDPDKPLPSQAIGQCPLAHCYNAHALLTLGLIPGATDVRYGDIRNRERADGTQWLQPSVRKFFNTQLVESNAVYSETRKKQVVLKEKGFRNIYKLAKKMRERLGH